MEEDRWKGWEGWRGEGRKEARGAIKRDEMEREKGQIETDRRAESVVVVEDRAARSRWSRAIW